jgi:thymidylate synthase (FAD)
MKAIKPFAEILDIGNDVDALKKIELIGRTCYKSTENIKEGSAEKFVKGLIKHGHEAMVEHASFCFEIDFGVFYWIKEIIRLLSTEHGFHSFMRFTIEDRILMSGNVRAWRDLFRNMMEWVGIPVCFEDFIKENPVLFHEYQDESFNPITLGSIRPVGIEDLKTENEFLIHCDITVRFVVDRGISHEIVRHRVASFAQESTRYCNYSKDKFGNQLTFIIPEFFQYGSPAWKVWKDAMECAEAYYLTLINMGVTPEEARTVLPNSLKTEVIMTANCGEWKHFFGLRACNVTGKAHPQMLEVTRPLLDDFKNNVSAIFDDLVYGE